MIVLDRELPRLHGSNGGCPEHPASRSALMAVAVIALVLLAPAPAATSTGFRVPFTITTASTSLHVTVWPNGQGHAPKQTYTLTCAPPGGRLPHPALACEKLVLVKRPFGPTPSGTPCTQIYGGPQEALVAGRFNGALVRARFSRKNGCEIARWNRVRFLFAEA